MKLIDIFEHLVEINNVPFFQKKISCEKSATISVFMEQNVSRICRIFSRETGQNFSHLARNQKREKCACLVEEYNRNYVLFWTTFSLSVFSATFGIAKFLKVGPCRLVSSHGPLGGIGSIGFLTLMLNIASTLVLKGNMLAESRSYPDQNIRYNSTTTEFVSGMMYSVPIIYGSSLVYVRKFIFCRILHKSITNQFYLHFRV